MKNALIRLINNNNEEFANGLSVTKAVEEFEKK